jgi:hypothetical protein
MGNALIGRLLASLKARGVDMLLRIEVQDLVMDNNTVTGAALKCGATIRRVAARQGVVLAAGGFNQHPRRRGELLPEGEIHSPSAPGNTGIIAEHRAEPRSPAR